MWSLKATEEDEQLDDLIRRAEEREAGLAERAGRRTALPLRYWRQTAHFTTPASDEGMARKAVEKGTEPVARMMERLGVTATMLGDRLHLPTAQIEALLTRPRRAPLVMIDGEDAQALREDVAVHGVESAVRVLRDGDWGPSLRFYRPRGLNLPGAAHSLISVLYQAGTGVPTAAYPLDGIVFPKLTNLDELSWLLTSLDEIEQSLKLEPGRIRVALLVESGAAAGRLDAIVDCAGQRLCALIFGLVDYSADVGLPTLAYNHPVADWARAEIVNAAGAAGVPAIDAMTVDYPVADPALDANANRTRFLDRMELVYRDAVHGRDMGMAGKWVGHPAQLFAVLLAFDAAFDPRTLDQEAQKLHAYERSEREDGRGATIIDGVMSDRATDRHARTRLRRAAANGWLDPEHARALGVIAATEVADARAAWKEREG
jgi:citrate lyase beta subunit